MKVNLEALSALVEQGYVSRKEHPEGGLFIYNYTPKAQYEPMWTSEVLMCRGLITDVDGNVVARPFDKFFNWLENNRRTDSHMVNVTEKMDGSLGILYRHNGKYRIATRGSFTGEQAIWATEFVNNHYSIEGSPTLKDWTLLFEIIYPENRIVVDYGNFSDLVLLAARNIETGEYLPYPELTRLADAHNFPLVKTYAFNDIGEILEQMGTLPASNEGYVVEFGNGERFKFKGDAYLTIHRIVTGLSFKRVLEAVQTGRYDELVQQIPDEFMDVVRVWKKEIDVTVNQIIQSVELHYHDAPKESQKEFALWVQSNVPKYLHSYMFSQKLGRDFVSAIYKSAFNNRVAADVPLVAVDG